ncbi:MAG TPA: hypothetical protein VHZ95_11850, partial [Polyangiales bacterium]|nr:hypothetical protein [Polyangiales bacterium]
RRRDPVLTMNAHNNTAFFPVRVEWVRDHSVTGVAWTPDVDNAINSFAETGLAEDWFTVEIVEDDLNDELDGVILPIMQAMGSSRGYRAYLKFVDDQGSPLLLVSRVERT